MAFSNRPLTPSVVVRWCICCPTNFAPHSATAVLLCSRLTFTLPPLRNARRRSCRCGHCPPLPRYTANRDQNGIVQHVQRADAVTRRDAAAPSRFEGADGALTGQRAAIFDIDVGRHRTVDRHHALFHPGITAIVLLPNNASVPAPVLVKPPCPLMSLPTHRSRIRSTQRRSTEVPGSTIFPRPGIFTTNCFHCRSPVHNIPAGYPLW